MRQKMLLLAAVFFGVLAFVLTYQQIRLEKQKILGATREVVLIRAIKTLTSGDKITAENIARAKVKRFKTSLVGMREIPWERKDSIIDRAVANPVKAGQFLTWNDFDMGIKGGRSGLTRLVQPGFRAISIAVDATSSVTGLIQPNDHIDIVGTFRFPEMKGDRAFDTITMTILQNVIVLATGTDMGRGTGGARGRTKKRGYSTITLSLTPKEVEMIIFASQKGRLTLSLRNYEETKMETDLQSVNFKFLEDNIKKYNLERQKKIRSLK